MHSRSLGRQRPFGEHFRVFGPQLCKDETGFSEGDPHRINDSDGDDVENDDTKFDRGSLRGRAASRVKMTTMISLAGTAAGGTRASKVAAARRGTQVRLCLSFSPACLLAHSVARAIWKLVGRDAIRRTHRRWRRCIIKTHEEIDECRERENERSGPLLRLL